MFRELMHRLLPGRGIAAGTTDWAALGSLVPPETIVDVGVASGTPALYDAFPEATLVLIEPVPGFHHQIEREILSRRKGTLLRTAVGASVGHASIIVETRDPSKSSILHRTALTRVKGSKESVRVPVSTLDLLLEPMTLGKGPLLKIDTEGYELEVLKGAECSLSRFRYVITEASVMHRFEGSYTLLDLLQFMKGRGFVIKHMLSAPRDRNGLIRMVDLLFEKPDAVTS